MIDDDLDLLRDVVRCPGATALQIRNIYYRDTPLDDIRNALRRLMRRGYILGIPYRDRHKATAANLLFCSGEGVDELERKGEVEAVRGELSMWSRDWQRHILSHPEVATLAYDVAAGMSESMEEKLWVYLPRGSAFDALVLTDRVQRGQSVGIIRAGPVLGDGGFISRVRRIQRGEGGMEHHRAYRRYVRGPQVVLVVVQTAFEKRWLAGQFDHGGRLSSTNVSCAFATEEEAARGVWLYERESKPIHITPRSIAQAPVDPHSEWQPLVPDPYKRNLPPLPANRLRPMLTPVESRAIDVLYRWPLIRPTELAPVIGTKYGGRLNEYVRGFRERGLVLDLNDLSDRHWREWNYADLEVVVGAIDALEREYRNRPMLLSDKGLRLMCARDRAPADGILYRWGEARRHKKTGEIGLGGDLRKALSDLAHTTGQNSVVARICADLPYTPDALPDHMSRRYYKGEWRVWRRGEEYEYRQPTSIAPDAAILLRGADGRERTILLEFERQATRGGQALTRKLMVWINYAAHGVRVYRGQELVAFVVPTESSLHLLEARWRALVSRELPSRLRPAIELVVTTEADFMDARDVTSDPIWTYANDPREPKVSLAIGMK